jgi:3-hydroxyisobutyrate dehydrogenase-like beta-hydroxyacid dehydrogenase
MEQMLEVGYIGLGNIGKPSARHLIRDGFNAHVYDVFTPAVAELEALGAIAHSSAGSLAADCAHIGVCVRDDGQVEEILYGPDGVFDNAAPDTLIAIHSTVTRDALLKWSADAQQRGLILIDAAISGGAQGAEAGTLCYMVGGDAAAVERARPIFETSADSIIHAGPVGAGLLLKLCNNVMTYAGFLAMSEATRLAEAGGLSAELLREVGKSNGVVNESMFQFVSNRNALAASCTEQQMDEIFGAFGRLGEKDLDCALQSARDMGVELPSTERLREVVYPMFLNKA